MISNSLLPAQLASDLKGLRVRYWLHGLRLRIHAPSVDALGRLIEPNLRWHSPTTGEVARPNKWQSYAHGKVLPRAALIEKVDRVRTPLGSGQGSAAEFRLVLWEILGNPNPSSQTAHRWLERMDSRVRSLAYAAPWAHDKRMPFIGFPALRGLELAKLRYADKLDTLALLTFALQQAHRLGRNDEAYELGREAVHSLWRNSLDLNARQLAEAMFDFYERWVLPKTTRLGLRRSVGDSVPEQLSTLTARVQLCQRIRRTTGELRDQDVCVRKVMSISQSGLYGWLPYGSVDVPAVRADRPGQPFGE